MYVAPTTRVTLSASHAPCAWSVFVVAESETQQVTARGRTTYICCPDTPFTTLPSSLNPLFSCLPSLFRLSCTRPRQGESVRLNTPPLCRWTPLVLRVVRRHHRNESSSLVPRAPARLPSPWPSPRSTKPRAFQSMGDTSGKVASTSPRR